jgi:hypothetical protein
MLPRSLLMMVLLLGWTAQSQSRELSAKPEETVRLSVSPEARMHDVPRIGMNLGIWTSWGAEQLGTNIIKNPGFEGLVDGSLATIHSTTGKTVILEGLGVHRPDGFWNGASINVRTGTSAGKSRRVTEFYSYGPNSKSIRAVLDSEISATPGDVVSLTKVEDKGAPIQWRLAGNENACSPGPPRPGSAGIRSLVLCSTRSQNAEASSYLDATTSRSGKLLLVRGKWRFSIWIRSLQATPRLKMSFARSASKPFFSKEVQPTAVWRRFVIDFETEDNGPEGPLQLQLSASGAGRIAVDDVSLASITDGAFPFRHQVVDALAVLRPGYLRDWQGQLGDSISNRLATAFARRLSRYRSDQAEDAKYEYSIPEFLQLCKRVGANPWLVLPTTGSDAEYIELGSFLAHAESRMAFREIVVEFGNENWNPLFGAAGIQDLKRHGEAAARAFRYVRKGSGPHIPIRTVVNAQFANPSAVKTLLSENVSDLVAVAPYFAYELPTSAEASQTDSTLFASERHSLGALSGAAEDRGKNLAVYEVNLHTTGGSASAAERDRFVLSSEAGAALAKRLIEAMSSGVRLQCVYTLAGFDAFTSDHAGFVQLWGVVRDLAGRPRLRTTGLAVSMLNDSVQDELHEIQAPGNREPNGLTAVAFRGSHGWTAAIVSDRNEPVKVSLSFPASRDEPLPVAALTLSTRFNDGTLGASPEYEQTTIVRNGENAAIEVTMPPRSLVVLASRRAGSRDSSGGTQ